MQLGNDLGGTVTLSGNNTYTGGTTIIAGNLIIASDAALGAAPPLTTAQFNSSLNLNSLGFPTNALAAVQADNGIIFNSLTEGNGTLTIGSDNRRDLLDQPARSRSTAKPRPSTSTAIP